MLARVKCSGEKKQISHRKNVFFILCPSHGAPKGLSDTAVYGQKQVGSTRGVHVKKRTVTTHFTVCHKRRFGHFISSYVYFLSPLLATSWLNSSIAITECML